MQSGCISTGGFTYILIRRYVVETCDKSKLEGDRIRGKWKLYLLGLSSENTFQQVGSSFRIIMPCYIDQKIYTHLYETQKKAMVVALQCLQTHFQLVATFECLSLRGGSFVPGDV